MINQNFTYVKINTEYQLIQTQMVRNKEKKLNKWKYYRNQFFHLKTTDHTLEKGWYKKTHMLSVTGGKIELNVKYVKYLLLENNAFSKQ